MGALTVRVKSFGDNSFIPFIGAFVSSGDKYFPDDISHSKV
ncbi:hypothetical protein [Methanospirillum purgamenti]|nr:hypothetical protein [Methanospirillum hungatei]